MPDRHHQQPSAPAGTQRATAPTNGRRETPSAEACKRTYRQIRTGGTRATLRSIASNAKPHREARHESRQPTGHNYPIENKLSRGEPHSRGPAWHEEARHQHMAAPPGTTEEVTRHPEPRPLRGEGAPVTDMGLDATVRSARGASLRGIRRGRTLRQRSRTRNTGNGNRLRA